MSGATGTTSASPLKHPLEAEADDFNPKRVRGPPAERERLGGPVLGEKRGRRGEEDEEEGREVKKQFQEEWEELDEGLGGEE